MLSLLICHHNLLITMSLEDSTPKRRDSTKLPCRPLVSWSVKRRTDPQANSKTKITKLIKKKTRKKRLRIRLDEQRI